MNTNLKETDTGIEETLRKTSQYLMPGKAVEQGREAAYQIYPATTIGANKIFNGYTSLAQWIVAQKQVVIDGYVGVFWDRVQSGIEKCLKEQGLSASWIDTADFLKSTADIETLVKPFLGEEQSVWGTKCTLSLADLYHTEKSDAQTRDSGADINIIIGPGAALLNPDAALLYLELPKNELQFRMRAGSINNLGAGELVEPFRMYKRFYFVDWVLLNKHKKSILSRIEAIVHPQWLLYCSELISCDC